jgi:hypothetical protein
MTRDEAVAYIQAHPKQFQGYAIETVLARVRSMTDPNYYNPTLFVADPVNAPKTTTTVKKPATTIPSKQAPVTTSIIAPLGKPLNKGLLAASALAVLAGGFIIFRATH